MKRLCGLFCGSLALIRADNTLDPFSLFLIELSPPV
jgi:hypothetical protein